MSAVKRVWGSCFAALYGTILRGTEKHGNDARRARLLRHAQGSVVELGAGTGHNLPHYPSEVELTLTEPEEPMAHRLERHLDRSGRSGVVIRSAAEHLPFPDDSADTVVSTLVLCTVEDPAASLREVRRVLRPGGRLLFLEHVAARSDSRLERWQRRLHGFWHGFAHGCNTNRDTEAAIRSSGLLIDELIEDELKRMPLIKPLVWGIAREPG